MRLSLVFRFYVLFTILWSTINLSILWNGLVFGCIFSDKPLSKNNKIRIMKRFNSHLIFHRRINIVRGVNILKSRGRVAKAWLQKFSIRMKAKNGNYPVGMHKHMVWHTNSKAEPFIVLYVHLKYLQMFYRYMWHEMVLFSSYSRLLLSYLITSASL